MGEAEAKVEARQRKHSPLPKYDGAGRGESDRYAPKVYIYSKNQSLVCCRSSIVPR